MAELTIPSEKLYVCLDEDNKLSLQYRGEIDTIIKNAEEFDGNIPFTVVGSINTAATSPQYLLMVKVGEATVVYEVLEANDEEEAKVKLKNKKRMKHRQIEVKRIVNLSKLIKEFYE